MFLLLLSLYYSFFFFSLFYCFKNDPIDFYLLFLFMFLFSNKFIFPISTLLYFFFKLHFPCFALFFYLILAIFSISLPLLL